MLADLLAQRLGMHPKIGRDMRDRALALYKRVVRRSGATAELTCNNAGAWRFLASRVSNPGEALGNALVETGDDPPGSRINGKARDYHPEIHSEDYFEELEKDLETVVDENYNCRHEDAITVIQAVDAALRVSRYPPPSRTSGPQLPEGED